MFDVHALSARQNPVMLIAGATAVGKSRFALEIAGKVPCVIINADSMQVYDAIPVLTAQPNARERAQVKHALYGTLAPDDVCSAARWASLAKDEIRRCWANDVLPVVLGGTGLYLRTLLDGISPIPDIAPDIRRNVRALLNGEGSLAVKAALKPHDPILANKLADNDAQRLSRALEVALSTGRPLSEWQQIAPTGGLASEPNTSIETTVLAMDRATLYARCDERLELMLSNGALDELQTLIDLKLDGSLPIMRAVGVPPLARFLAGTLRKDEALDMAQRDTRRFAKRQLTWLRNQFGKWNWINV